MAEAARIEHLNPNNYFENEQPLVLVVPELSGEEMVHYRAERLVRHAGQIASSQLVEKPKALDSRNLMEAVHAYKEGSDQAGEMVKMNVSTAVIEHTIKSAHVLEVEMEIGDDDIYQHGQSLENIQANTLVYASDIWQMRQRAEAENRNSFRLKSTLTQGLLEDYVFVVFSRVPDDMTTPELKKVGFFTDTMSCAIQATSLNDSNKLTTQSAFVAGIDKPEGTKHDEQTLTAVGQQLGVDYAGKNTTEIIDTPLLIHKSLMPNGVIDLVKLWDDCAGGTFFGEDRPREDYLEYLQYCRGRLDDYLPRIQEIMGQLRARADYITSPDQAIRLLDKLCDQKMVEQAIDDRTINPKVFGTQAAFYIEQGRIGRDKGNENMAQANISRAKRVSNSTSCPSGLVKDSRREASADKEDSLKETWDGGKKHYNSMCRSCRKVKLEVGACHICQDCVKHPARMKKAYQAEKKQQKSESERVNTIKLRQNLSAEPALKAA